MNYTEAETLTTAGIKLVNYLPDIGIKNVREEIFKGLSSSPKYISSKFFYDKKGSELFEEITKLDEYYPTRTEKLILSNIVKQIDLDFSGLGIVELGSGDHSKISLLFRQLSNEILASIKYYPIDISQSAIEKSSEYLINEFSMLNIEGIVADFIHHLNLIPKTGRRLFCFFGSTIGNLDRNEIKAFMSLLSDEMKIGDSLFLGMDMIKDLTVVEKAYNDSKRITAAFNKNILNVINDLVGTNFEPDNFEHLAFYNKTANRIEMHLKAKRDMMINCSPEFGDISFKKGETIHTENSYKFSKEDIITFGNWANLEISKILTDENHWFSLVYYKKKQV